MGIDAGKYIVVLVGACGKCFLIGLLFSVQWEARPLVGSEDRVESIRGLSRGE